MHTSDYFSREDLASLMKATGAPRASVYLPTHRKGMDTRQDPIRLKNLLTEAENSLAQRIRRTEAIDMLEDARALIEQDGYWSYQSDGLAVFVEEGGTRVWRVPTTFEETCVVADAFHLKPLLPLLASDGLFYVLALSENDVRLLQGTRHSVNELLLPDVPSAMEELLATDGEGAALNFHTGAGAGTTTGRAAVFHGHGGMDRAAEKDLRLKFFRQVDKALRDFFRDHPAPLVLAGVESHFAQYREANSFDGLVPEGIPGSPDRTSADDLHASAWKIVEPIFQQSATDARATFEQFAGTGRTTTDVAEATKLAMEGRAQTAFVAVGVQAWGSWDEPMHQARLHEFQHPDDRDLLNEIAIRTLATGGSVFVVPPADVPGGGLAAVVSRY